MQRFGNPPVSISEFSQCRWEKGAKTLKRRTLRKIRRGAKLAGVIIATAYVVSSIVCLAQDSGGYNLGTMDPKFYEAKAGSIDEEHTTETFIPGVEAEAKAEIEATTETMKPTEHKGMIYSYDWDADEAYLLAKIAMAEAEGEDTEGKALVILVTLNRVWSDSFPNSIEEVILQDEPCIQFSVTAEGGRFWNVEPDADCWEALRLVESGWNESQDALYFESQSQSRWHQENLEFLFEHGNHYFYRDKE